ncbi:leucyl/phenylalanyl-tRNA--protein transferase [Sesbania bispinosa]|nr:leucyl/phenylalanyl-tRNA--protein transferase [Sesbania bispinosa]
MKQPKGFVVQVPILDFKYTTVAGDGRWQKDFKGNRSCITAGIAACKNDGGRLLLAETGALGYSRELHSGRKLSEVAWLGKMMAGLVENAGSLLPKK